MYINFWRCRATFYILLDLFSANLIPYLKPLSHLVFLTRSFIWIHRHIRSWIKRVRKFSLVFSQSYSHYWGKKRAKERKVSKGIFKVGAGHMVGMEKILLKRWGDLYLPSSLAFVYSVCEQFLPLHIRKDSFSVVALGNTQS
jgi:hypothetical protein